VTWNAVAGAEAYNVFYSTSPDFSEDSGVQKKSVTTNSVSIPNLVGGTMYYFVVASLNATGSSPYSFVKNARPAEPVPMEPAPSKFDQFNKKYWWVYIAAGGGVLGLLVLWGLYRFFTRSSSATAAAPAPSA
jgi:hypothetical protein